jgi:hypothetical protein
MNTPTWSRDSEWVYCDPEGPESRVRRVHVPDGRIETIADLRQFQVPWGGVDRTGSPIVSRVTGDIYAFALTARR